MKKIIMKLVFVSGIIISVILISSFLYLQNYQSEFKSESNPFSWKSFSDDAKHSWDGQELLKNKYSPFQYLPLMYTNVLQESNTLITYDILDAAIGMYMITGDEEYLNKALLITDEIEKLMINNKFIPIDVPRENMMPVTTNRDVLNHIAHFSLLDGNKAELVSKLADTTMEYGINKNTNLFYEFNFFDGTPGGALMYFPYGGDVNLESLLRSYEVTNDEKYLNQVKKTILAYWDLRDKTTNLIPSQVNSTNNEITTEFMQQYGSGLFLKILLHYYYLTDDPEILNIIDEYTNSLSKHVWNGKTWNYRTNYNGTIISSEVEANFLTLDDAFFLLYDLNKTKYEHLYEIAKADYDNSFQNDLILTNNGLVAHSVKTDGSMASPESRLSYAFTSIQNPAYFLFINTQDKSYLDKVEYFYKNAIKHHKHEYGYTNGINAYTLNDEWQHIETHALMPSAIANKLLLTILPSSNVDITWTVIGNHKLPVPFFTTFYSTGYFNAVHFNLENKEIVLDFVNGEGTITFESKIKNVWIDGKSYENFEDNVLKTISGEHNYKISLE
jgi:hypothetical protein